jgi:hypothetical protein
MAVTLDLSTDYLVWDDPEAVTLTSVRNGGNATAAVANAFRLQLTTRELAASGGAYQALDRVFLVPRAELPAGWACKVGDKVTDADAVVYNVLNADHQLQRTLWRLVCRDPVIAYDLRDLVDLYAPTWAQDATGARIATYAAVASNLAGRLQPTDGKRIEELGKPGDVRTYTLTLAAAVAVTTDHQVRAGGVIYEVTGWRNEGRIDELMVVDLVRKFA